MDHRAIIDVVCKSGLNKLADEISALLGQDLTCSDIHIDLTTKDALFSDPSREKTALTKMSVGGDQEGSAFLLTGISAAAILGGTLIMLPQDMIEEHAQEGKLDGELNDAFGEVANIIAGVFTQAFVDKYPKTIRFIKKSVEELVPTKIDLASEEPFPPGNYYLASCRMKVEDKDLGPLELVVPAAVLGLETTTETTPEKEKEQAPEPTQATTAATPEDNSAPAAEPTEKTAPAPQASPPKTALKRRPFAEAKKLVDTVFRTTISQIGEEIGALLGQTLKCDDIQLQLTSKAEFFSKHCVEKSILTHMKVTGDKEGLGYMVAQIADAIIMGGTLIMLPEDQIEEQRKTSDFDGEVADAYGEIANILSGSLTQTFLDRYPQQIRFIKTDAETVVPTKILPDSEEPFSEGSFYLASFAIHMDDYELDRLLLIFPAEVFGLDQEQEQEHSSAPEKVANDATQPAPGEWGGPPLAAESHPAPVKEEQQTPTKSEVVQDDESQSPLVLIVSDQIGDARPFVDILSSAGFECRTLSFQDEVRELFQQNKIIGIFLIMTQVGEKGFAAAIKLQSAGKSLPPLIFAGPEWTRSAVLRAVKYGAKDILMTPASGEEIQEKVSRHLKKAS